jgi:hypothetical protein
LFDPVTLVAVAFGLLPGNHSRAPIICRKNAHLNAAETLRAEEEASGS